MEGIFSNIYLLLGCGLDVVARLVGAGDLSKYNRVIFTHEENSDRRRPQCTLNNIGSKCSKFCRFCVLVYYIYIYNWCLFILHFLPWKTWKMNRHKNCCFLNLYLFIVQWYHQPGLVHLVCSVEIWNLNDSQGDNGWNVFYGHIAAGRCYNFW